MWVYAITGQGIEQLGSRSGSIFLLFIVKIAEGNPWPLAFIAWKNSRHLATLPLVSPPNGVRETSTEIPYWRRVATEIWVVLIGRVALGNLIQPIRSTTQIWVVMCPQYGIIFCAYSRRHLAGKLVVALPNVGCFLSPWPLLTAPSN